MKKIKDNSNKILMPIFSVLIVLFGLLLVFMVGENLKIVTYGSMLESHIVNNNLSLPFPKYWLNDTNPLYYSEVNKIFNQDLNTFHNTIKNNYYYEVNTYDCKYWSFVWLNYWKYNKDVYNWDVKFIETNNHIFLMVYNESGYCIMDGNELICLE